MKHDFPMSWRSWVAGVEGHYAFLQYAERRCDAGQALSPEEENRLRISQQVVSKYHLSGYRKRVPRNSFTEVHKKGPEKMSLPASGLRPPKQAETTCVSTQAERKKAGRSSDMSPTRHMTPDLQEIPSQEEISITAAEDLSAQAEAISGLSESRQAALGEWLTNEECRESLGR